MNNASLRKAKSVALAIAVAPANNVIYLDRALKRLRRARLWPRFVLLARRLAQLAAILLRRVEPVQEVAPYREPALRYEWERRDDQRLML